MKTLRYLSFLLLLAITVRASDANIAANNLLLLAPKASPTFTGSARFSYLTSGRIPIISTSGLLTDSSSFTWDSGGGGTFSAGSLKATGLTSGRVPIAGASGLLGDDADFTFLTDTLSATKVVASSGITAGGTVGSSVTDSAALATDDTYSGNIIAGLNSGATTAQWEAVYLNGSAAWVLADANGSGTYPARGIGIADSTSNALSVLVRGTVRNDAWTWTPGGTIYLSATPGALTQTAPSTSGDKVQAVGFALTADIAYFDFDSTFVEVP